MEWIVTTARTVDEARTRALDLLGVDLDDAEVQVIEEGKTGLFGRTKTEARVRARIKPKAPPVKEEGRQRRDNRGKGGGNRNRGDRNRGKGGGNRSGGGGGGGESKSRKDNKADKQASNDGGRNKNRNDGGGKGGDRSKSGGAGGGNRSGGAKSNDGGNKRNRGRGRDDRGGASGEDRVEMPIEEQRENLEAFVAGVAAVFDEQAKVELVEDGTTLIAQVTGENLGRLVGPKAQTLQTLEELSRTAMHRAAAGRRYHRIQVDVDNYRARRREALERFAVQVAESVVDSGESKAMEPMGAADRKIVHDAVSGVSGVETVSEGRDPRRYIVILPLAGSDEEE